MMRITTNLHPRGTKAHPKNDLLYTLAQLRNVLASARKQKAGLIGTSTYQGCSKLGKGATN